jgi:hypothetical protein
MRETGLKFVQVQSLLSLPADQNQDTNRVNGGILITLTLGWEETQHTLHRRTTENGSSDRAKSSKADRAAGRSNPDPCSLSGYQFEECK